MPISPINSTSQKGLAHGLNAQAISYFLNFLLLIINPLIVICLKSFVRNYRVRLGEQVLIATSVALFFCNRDFGVDLGGGAIDDVPQYVYLFNQATTHHFTYLLQGWSFEPGFIALTKILALFLSSPKMYLFFIFFILNFCIIRASTIINKKNPLLAYFFFIGFFGLNTYIVMHVLRQALGFGFIILAMAESSTRTNSIYEKPWTLAILLVGCSMHISAVMFALAYLVAKIFWTKSRLILFLGLFSVTLAPILAQAAFSAFTALSPRIEGYEAAKTIALIGSSGLAAAVGMSTILIFTAIRFPSRSEFSSLWYVGGVLGLAITGVALFSIIPVQAVFRQLAFTLALLSMIFAGLLESDTRQMMVIRYFILAVCCIRFLVIIGEPAPHLLPFQKSGALNPLSGILTNGYDLWTSPKSVPAYMGWGDLQ